MAVPALGRISISHLPALQMLAADRCHALSIPVVAASLFGFWGVFFIDFGVHRFMRDVSRFVCVHTVAADYEQQ